MDKKLLVFSILVSLFILGGMSFALANAGSGLHTYGGNKVPTNTSFGTVCGSTCRLNLHNGNNSDASPVWNITIYYNSTAGATPAWTTATLAGVASNTTCSGNICNKTGNGDGGASFLVDWTVPSTNGDYRLVVRYRWRNGTRLNSSLNALVNVDTTKPTVTLGGNVTDAFVFYSTGRLAQATGKNLRMYAAGKNRCGGPAKAKSHSRVTMPQYGARPSPYTRSRRGRFCRRDDGDPATQPLSLQIQGVEETCWQTGARRQHRA